MRLQHAPITELEQADTSVGGTGPDLGFGGLQGLAVTLDPRQVGKARGNNFAGLSTGKNKAGLLVFQVRALSIAPLRTGTHIMSLRITTNTAGTDVLIVSLDGNQIFQQPEPLLNKWKTVRVAFTAGTGSLTDVHIVREVALWVP